MCNNLGAVYFCKELGFNVHGGEFLNITNTASVLWAEEYGLTDILVSIEITDEQINALGGNIKRGLVSYGYIPLMLTRNCPVKSGRKDCRTCKKHGKMQDRKKYEFSLYCDGNCVEVLNSVPLNILSEINKKFSHFSQWKSSMWKTLWKRWKTTGKTMENEVKPQHIRVVCTSGA